MKAIADEPADRDVDLRFAHQSSVMNDTKKKTRQHQTDGDFRIDARPAVLGAVEIGNFVTQPRSIKNPINPGKDMIVRDQLTERTSDEQLQLIAFLPPEHPPPH